MHQNELSSDDLDQLFKGIQSKLEGKEDIINSLIPKFQEKYKFFQMQESSKKYIYKDFIYNQHLIYLYYRLLGRFQYRLSELMEKCKNQNQFNYLVGIQQKLITFNIIQILDQINNSGIENKAKDIVPQFKQPTNWQQNNKINKSLFEFYEDHFWRLYGILLLNEYLYIDFKRKHRKYDITQKYILFYFYIEINLISNVSIYKFKFVFVMRILYYQSKQDNVERLLKISLERNRQFFYIQQLKYPQLATIENKAQQMNFSQINYTMETPYQNRNIRMFGTLTQNQKFNRFIVFTIVMKIFMIVYSKIDLIKISRIRYSICKTKKYFQQNCNNFQLIIIQQVQENIQESITQKMIGVLKMIAKSLILQKKDQQLIPKILPIALYSQIKLQEKELNINRFLKKIIQMDKIPKTKVRIKKKLALLILINPLINLLYLLNQFLRKGNSKSQKLIRILIKPFINNYFHRKELQIGHLQL